MRIMKYTVILLILALSVTCTACAYIDNIKEELDHDWIKPEKDIPEKAKLNRYMDNLITALDADDKDSVKQLFAPTAIENIVDFDVQLGELFDFYKGECISIEATYGGHVEDANNAAGDHRIEKKADDWYIVTTSQNVYRIYIQTKLIDSLDDNNVGIVAIYINEGTEAKRDLENYEYGIFITKD